MNLRTLLIKRMYIFVLCMSLCMAQFILLPSYAAYADEDDDDEEDDDDDRRSDSSSEINEIKRQIEESKAAKEKPIRQRTALHQAWQAYSRS